MPTNISSAVARDGLKTPYSVMSVRNANKHTSSQTVSGNLFFGAVSLSKAPLEMTPFLVAVSINHPWK